MGVHVVGMRINGELGRFMETFDDQQLDDLLHGRLIPSGFVCWHVEEEELDGHGLRVQAIGALPYVVVLHPRRNALDKYVLWPSNIRIVELPFASAAQALALAWPKEKETLS